MSEFVTNFLDQTTHKVPPKKKTTPQTHELTHTTSPIVHPTPKKVHIVLFFFVFSTFMVSLRNQILVLH